MMTICKKCRWFCNSGTDPTSMRMESCKAPKITTRCPITGIMNYPDCGEINKDGNCPHYEEKLSWYKRLWEFFVDGTGSVGKVM